MALEAVVEAVFRAITHFVGEIVLVGIFYWPGWVILRVLTLGRYPPPKSHPHNHEFVATVGLVLFLTVLMQCFSGALT